MARGVVAGIISGTVVAAGAAAILSVTLSPPVGRAPEEVATGAPREPVVPAMADDEASVPREPEADVAPVAGDAPSAPESDPPETPPAEPQPLASPEVGEAPEGGVPVPADTEDATPEITGEAETPVGAGTPGVSEAPDPEVAPRAETDPAPTPDVAEVPATADMPRSEPAPEAPDAETAPANAPSPEAPQEPREEEPLPSATDPEAPTAATERPGVGIPARSAGQREPAVVENRLPRIGDVPEEEAPEEAAPSEGSPLRQNALPVEVEEGAPRMAVILIDDGSGPMGPETLGAFPFPLSFAISPDHPDPEAAAAAYRELGYEVLALVGVPGGTDGESAGTSLRRAFEAVPRAVAVLEDPEGGLQASRAVSDQVAETLVESGHGLVMLPNGLNTAQQLAARAGVPSLTLFRDFDGEGQDQGVIRRFLDQGAFKARQEGVAAMLGRMSADTISALVLWGLQDRASSVAMVPVSMVLGSPEE